MMRHQHLTNPQPLNYSKLVSTVTSAIDENDLAAAISTEKAN